MHYCTVKNISCYSYYMCLKVSTDLKLGMDKNILPAQTMRLVLWNVQMDPLAMLYVVGHIRQNFLPKTSIQEYAGL